MSEQAIISALSIANVKAHTEFICRNIPTRLAGSENGKRMAEYSAKALNDAGVPAEVIELPGLVSFPDKAEFRVLWPAETAIEANTLGHSLQTLPDGISGELVYVGSGAFSEYQGKDVTGKIILTELSYSPARHEKQRIAGLKGAIGCVMMNWGGPQNTAVPFGSVKPVWGNPTPENYKTEMPTLPCIGVARTAGLRLKEMCAQGKARVWFRTHVENGWRGVHLTIGEVRAARGEDFVVLGGHQDSWPGEAATDNAAGNSCIFELARVFNQHRDKLRRGLVCGLWPGHETGTMIGSSWFVDRNWDRLRRHQVAYMQIDQPACVGTTRWGSSSNAELKRFHQEVEKRLLGNRPYFWKRQAKNGDASFFGLGIPMMHGEGAFTEDELKATALANLGWWHHSIECTLDKVDFDWLADHLRIYGAYLWELLTAPILPYEFGAVADQFVVRLAELSPDGAAVGLDGALAAAQGFKQATGRFDSAVETWRGRYHNARIKDEAAAEIINDSMKRLSRLLVPMASTAKGTYGHDPYGYTPQTTMIPCLYDVPQLAKLPRGEERWMLETKLVRERNRVADALNDARRVIDDTLRQLA